MTSAPPLTALSGYCELFLEEALGAITSEQREVLKRMKHCVTRLARINDAMFNLTVCYGTARAKVHFEEVDIRECLDQALQEVAPMVAEKRIALTADIQPPAVPLLLGKPQIVQVLVNLLDNACRFSPRNGAIVIRGYSCFCGPGEAMAVNSFRVDIRDSGPGIPPAHAREVFREYRSYTGGNDRSGGGLDLAICRMILEWHGGRIWAEPDPSGAVFSFVLPLQLDSNLPLRATEQARATAAGRTEHK